MNKKKTIDNNCQNTFQKSANINPKSLTVSVSVDMLISNLQVKAHELGVSSLVAVPMAPRVLRNVIFLCSKVVANMFLDRF